MMNAEMLNKATCLPLDEMMRLAMEIFDTPRPAPPAWMVAPNLRGEMPVAVREEQPAAVPVAQIAKERAPFRSIHEVRRAY